MHNTEIVSKSVQINSSIINILSIRIPGCLDQNVNRINLLADCTVYIWLLSWKCIIRLMHLARCHSRLWAHACIHALNALRLCDSISVILLFYSQSAKCIYICIYTYRLPKMYMEYISMISQSRFFILLVWLHGYRYRINTFN